MVSAKGEGVAETTSSDTLAVDILHRIAQKSTLHIIV